MNTMTTDADVIIVGSGAGGLLAAVCAADAGLSALVLEKTRFVGGTSAISGGGIWVPCNDQLHGADSLDDAFRYVRTCARGQASDDRILAYLETVPRLARYLRRLGVGYRWVPGYSDYYPELPGARPDGRTMDPEDFDVTKLGLAALKEIRPTGQLLMGRVSINAFDAHAILTRQRGALWRLVKLMLRYWLDVPWRLKTRRDRRLTGGQALVAGLYAALRERGGTVWRDTPMRELTIRDGVVAGVVVERDGQRVALTARHGVLLACGGFERNQSMRDQYLPKPTNAAWTATPVECNTGDGITAGNAAGGALHLMDQTWGGPTVEIPGVNRCIPILVERSMPGCMVVNAQGKRFVDESCPYPEFQQAMFADHAVHGGAIPAWIVFDADFRARYPIGPLLPGIAMPDSRLPEAWWNRVVWKSDTLAGLAAATGIDGAGLLASAARMGEFARAGRDSDFNRGGNAIDRFYSDGSVKPNPNLAPIATGPFYAMKLWPGDIGTKGGLLTTRDACVLGTNGAVIQGLYAVGNCSASVMGPAYPGPGSTIGPAMTFAFRAVSHMARKPIALEHPELLREPLDRASEEDAGGGNAAADG